MRMKTCLTLILTEMEAESEEDDDDEDDDGKKVSGDVTQSWGAVVLNAVAICHCLQVLFIVIVLFLYVIAIVLMCAVLAILFSYPQSSQST